MRTCRSCLTIAEPRKRNCQACGKRLPKPPKRRPAHRAALAHPLEVFVQANGGYPGCWVCRDLGIQMAGKPQRDHWHSGPKAGQPRGVLCPFHNRKLGAVYTQELVGAYWRYLTKETA